MQIKQASYQHQQKKIDPKFQNVRARHADFS